MGALLGMSRSHPPLGMRSPEAWDLDTGCHGLRKCKNAETITQTCCAVKTYAGNERLSSSLVVVLSKARVAPLMPDNVLHRLTAYPRGVAATPGQGTRIL